MPRLLKLLPLLLAVFWLPFSAVAAVAMPFCLHAHSHDSHNSHDPHRAHEAHEAHAPQAQHGDHGDHGDTHLHAHGHASAAAATADVSTAADAGGALTDACDACGICHLACAGLIPPGSVPRELLPTADRYAVAPAPTFSSLVAEPLPRPPQTA